VNGSNAAPKAPTNLTAVVSGADVTVGWKIPSSPSDPDSGDSVESFRVYRRGATVPPATAWTTADRIGPAGYDSMRVLCSGSTTAGAACGYNDAATDGAQHQYMVTSVDSHLRESVYITSAAPSA
jgi:hypothetical protein